MSSPTPGVVSNRGPYTDPAHVAGVVPTSITPVTAAPPVFRNLAVPATDRERTQEITLIFFDATADTIVFVPAAACSITAYLMFTNGSADMTSPICDVGAWKA